MLSNKHARRGAILSVLALFLVACLAVPGFRGVFADATNNVKGIEIHCVNPLSIGTPISTLTPKIA